MREGGYYTFLCGLILLSTTRMPSLSIECVLDRKWALSQWDIIVTRSFFEFNDVLLLSLFLWWRSQISSICSYFFIKCNPSLPHSRTGLSSFSCQRSRLQCHHQHPQRCLHRPDRASEPVREWGCYTFLCGSIVLSTT